jgi:hypothetical protein
MAQVAGRVVVASPPAVPARGTVAWLAAHGHPQTACIHGCKPPAVLWDCPLVHECDDDADPYYLCSCHWALL